MWDQPLNQILALCAISCLVGYAPGAASSPRFSRQDVGESTAAQDPPASELSDEGKRKLAAAREALAVAVDAREEGELEAAREYAAKSIAALNGLEEDDSREVLELVLEVDRVASTLRLLDVQLAAREWILEVRVRTLPGDHSILLGAQFNLATTRDRIGDLTGALELFEEVHAAFERLLPEEDFSLLAVKANLAMTLAQLGDLERALRLQEYVHSVSVRVLPPDDPRRLSAQGNLAITRKSLGDLESALELLEVVHEARERLLPAHHPQLLRTKTNLGATRMSLSDFEGAHELFEYVHAAHARLLAEDHPSLLGAKINLAGTRLAFGDTAGALELLEYVHAAQARRLHADHLELLKTKGNLSQARRKVGDLEGARELAEYVHDARERSLSEDHPDLLTAKINLAVANEDLGDLDSSLALLEHVLAVRKRLLSADHPGLLLVMGNLALTRKKLGDPEGALELDEHVHAARERLLPPDHPHLLVAKANLAHTRSTLGDSEGAVALMRSLLQGQLVRARALSGEAPRVARSSALRELQRLPLALFLSEAETSVDRSLDAELFSVLESLRQVSTSSAQVALAISERPELEKLRDRLADTRTRLNDLGITPPKDVSDLEDWRKELVSLADDRDALEKTLRTGLAEQGVFNETITAAGVAAALDADSAAISFFRYQRFQGPDAETGAVPPARDSLLAFVVQPAGTVHRVELGASAELEELCTRWRASLGKPVERGVSLEQEAESEVEVGRALRERILAPCFQVLGEDLPATLHLVLDDFLLLVPVDSLPWSDGRRVGEVLSLRIEISMQRLVAPPPGPSGEGTLVALGGVKFGAEDVEAPRLRVSTVTPPTSYRSASPVQFKPLLQSRLEVEALGVLYDDLLGGEPKVLLKEQAAKKALVESAPEARYLHLATHGWFAPERIQSMHDGLEEAGGDQSMSLTRAEESLRGFAPETLCGLALAGANHGRNSLGKVPGILTAEELSVLDLSNCELAVLSACETNVGIRRAGQGIQSLQGALHAAGARTAVTSLWKVDDASTRRLMEIFYTELWGGELGKADALWAAKMALRDEGYAIRDWAGWVLTGDPD